MQFSEFKRIFQNHVSTLLQNRSVLFIADIDKDALWNLYLDSFPAGTNEVYRQRREFDCSCCKNFIRAFGGTVVISGNEVKTIWDFHTGDTTFQPVIDALSAFIKAAPVSDAFVTKERAFGTEASYEHSDDESVITWNHFRVDLPAHLVARSSKSEASLMSEYRDNKSVFRRSLDEISEDALDTVLELIAQK